jgi:mannose-6-phosphate isomerase-like protein (cupin superfamily)
LILAYLNTRTSEAADDAIGTRHRLHLHEESWEYYTVLQGTKTLQIENEMVKVAAGEILEVSPGVRHTLRERQAPYEGLTFRVPVPLDDKVEWGLGSP